MNIFPPKLKKGDKVRVVAPALSLAIISQETRTLAEKRFQELDLNLEFGAHCEEIDEFVSSPLASRLEDFHEAFADQTVKAIISVIGGFNCNQMLPYIDWELIKKNPKILCGYSDITALQNAILAKIGLVTYSSPHYCTFGQELHFGYTLEYFQRCLLNDDPFAIMPSDTWSDDQWWMDQKNRNFIDNPGWQVINQGKAIGTVIGGNLCTMNLLQGTEYFPDMTDSILFLEDDENSKPGLFDRNLESLTQQTGFAGVKGIVTGRFQKGSEMTAEKFNKIIKNKKPLEKIPVLANVDFGHTFPLITFPIGGTASLVASHNGSKLEIINH